MADNFLNLTEFLFHIKLFHCFETVAGTKLKLFLFHLRYLLEVEKC